MKENLESDESEIRLFEKELHERKEIEEILESTSKVTIPSYEAIKKLCEIIENYYETIEKCENEGRRLSENEIKIMQNHISHQIMKAKPTCVMTILRRHQ